MNEQFEKLMYQSGLLADGCWGDMDSYDQGAITKFAELIVQECCTVLQTEDIRHSGYGYNQGFLHKKIKEHFGVKS